jgi:hypothetical protein
MVSVKCCQLKQENHANVTQLNTVRADLATTAAARDANAAQRNTAVDAAAVANTARNAMQVERDAAVAAAAHANKARNAAVLAAADCDAERVLAVAATATATGERDAARAQRDAALLQVLQLQADAAELVQEQQQMASHRRNSAPGSLSSNILELAQLATGVITGHAVSRIDAVAAAVTDNAAAALSDVVQHARNCLTAATQPQLPAILGKHLTLYFYLVAAA